MAHSDFRSDYKHGHQVRFQRTLEFVKKHYPNPKQVLDLGPENPLANLLRQEGHTVTNTPENQDLDLEFEIVENEDFDLVTAFEIFEHMVSPFPLLKNIAADYLIASVPLNLWFSKAYWNEDDPYDRHFHEFEERQFKMLLNKAGWEIKASDKWIHKPRQIFGIRPLLRRITPRHLIVYCERMRV